MMVVQCKGKDYSKVPASKMPADSDRVLHSVKRDGHYIQAQMDGKTGKVKFYTSGGKEFYVPEWAYELAIIFAGHSVTIEMEYVGKTNGELGSLTKCGRLSTYRADFGRGKASVAMEGELSYINAVYPTDSISCTDYAEWKKPKGMRYDAMVKYLRGFKIPPIVKYFKIEKYSTATFASAMVTAKSRIAKGLEGSYVLIQSAVFESGKRQNTRIKLKAGGKVTLPCIGTTNGDGKYDGMIGALILDTDGTVHQNTVNVGSGLTDAMRAEDPAYFIGREIPIKYFLVKDNYTQPVIDTVALGYGE